MKEHTHLLRNVKCEIFWRNHVETHTFMANELHKFQCSRHRQYNGSVMKLTFFQSHQSLLIFVGTFFSWACYVRSGHKLWPTTVFWWRMLRHRSKNEVHKFDYIIDTWIHDMTTHSHNSLKIYCYSNAKWTTCKMFMVEYFPVDWNWIVTGYTQNILFFGKNEEIALAFRLRESR